MILSKRLLTSQISLACLRNLRNSTYSTASVYNRPRSRSSLPPNSGEKSDRLEKCNPSTFVISRGLHLGHHCLAGHSHAQNIRHIKLKKDGEKAKKMSYLVKKIMSACKQSGGTDPKINRSLDKVLEECRAAAMTKETIQRTLDRAKNQKEKKILVSIKGPSGSYYLLQCEVDSKRWMENQIRKMLKNFPPGLEIMRGDCLQHFEPKGIIFVQKAKKEAEEDSEATVELSSLDEAEEVAIEVGAEEVMDSVDDSGEPAFEFICDIGVIQGVEKALRQKNLGISGSEAIYRSLYQVQLNESEKEMIGQFFDKLDDDEYVERIYDNIA